MTESKYAVLRADDFERIAQHAGDDGSGRPASAYWGMTLEVGTYFVLRDSDVLATQVLWSYVHTIQTMRELSRGRPGMLSTEEEKNLTDLEDYVQDLAVQWQRRGRGRLPT